MNPYITNRNVSNRRNMYFELVITNSFTVFKCCFLFYNNAQRKIGKYKLNYEIDKNLKWKKLYYCSIFTFWSKKGLYNLKQYSDILSYCLLGIGPRMLYLDVSVSTFTEAYIRIMCNSIQVDDFIPVYCLPIFLN